MAKVHCQLCDRTLHRLAGQRRHVSGLTVCRRCEPLSIDEITEGNVRCDRSQRCYVIVRSPLRARYVFGERRVPSKSEPSTAEAMAAQCDAMWERVVANQGIGRSVVLKFVLQHAIARSDMDDVMSDVCVPALMRAAIGWRDDDTSAFSTYAYRCCFNALVRYVKQKKRSSTMTLEGADAIAAEAEHKRTNRDSQVHERLESIRHVASAQELWALEQVSVEGATLEDVASLMRITRSSLHGKLSSLRRRLCAHEQRALEDGNVCENAT